VKKLHFPIMIEIDEDGYFIVSCPVFGVKNGKMFNMYLSQRKKIL
jgi:hypothetical protein